MGISSTLRATAVFLVFACGSVVGCTPTEPAPSTPAEPCRPRNLILISVDTLRADHLGAYGYERDTSPFLDELASRGVLFERAYATASWTVPSHASMMTGLYPRDHGMRRSGRRVRTAIPGDVETLAERFQKSGFATAGYSNMLYLSTRNGFDRGFDSWTERGAAMGNVGSMPALSFEVLDWIDEHRDDPFFVFLHVYDVHTRYQPLDKYRDMFVGTYDGPAIDGDEKPLVAHRAGAAELGSEDAAHLVNLYDAEIRQLDSGMRRFFALLSETGVLDDTAVLITSDHGEEFYEHGDFLHGRTLYEELVRIPWILVGPCLPAGVRVSEPVSLVDVVPTSFGLMGVGEAGAGVSGMDVSGWWQGESADVPRPIFMEGDQWNARRPGEFGRAVVSGDRKLYLRGRTGHESKTELYDLRKDPFEQDDLIARGETDAELAASLEAFMAVPERAGPAIPPPERSEVQRLRALGYIE